MLNLNGGSYFAGNEYFGDPIRFRIGGCFSTIPAVRLQVM